MGDLNIVQITNTELVRDMKTNAILNTDVEGLQRYKAQRRKALREKQESQETKQRLNSLEKEVLNLKNIISELATLKRSRGE